MSPFVVLCNSCCRVSCVTFGLCQFHPCPLQVVSGVGVHEGQPAAVPVTLLLVDVSGPDEFLDLVRSGITVSLEALDPSSLVGVIGVCDSITLVGMAGERQAWMQRTEATMALLLSHPLTCSGAYAWLRLFQPQHLDVNLLASS